MIIERLNNNKGLQGKFLIKCDYCNKESVNNSVYENSKRQFCNDVCYKKYLVKSMLLKQKDKQKLLISNC